MGNEDIGRLAEDVANLRREVMREGHCYNWNMVFGCEWRRWREA